MKEVFLIRHGQTRENELGIIIGQRDPPLSPKGRENVQALRPLIPFPDVVFSSDLRRASETASLLFPSHEVKHLPQLRERHFGSLEGKSRNLLQNIRLHQTTASNENHMDIEPSTSIAKRIHHVLITIQSTPARKIIMVGHGAFFRSMIAYLLPDLTPSQTLKNGQYHRLTFGDRGQVIHAKLNQSWI